MKNFKRFAAAALALAMLFAFSACGRGAESENSPSDEIGDVAATPTPVPTPLAYSRADSQPTPEPTPEPTPAPTPVPPVVTPQPSTEPSVPPETEAPSADGVDLSAFFNTIASSYELASLMDMDSTLLDNYYPGLTGIAAKQLIAKMPMITASANEIVLVECASESDAAAVKAIFEARKQSPDGRRRLVPRDHRAVGQSRDLRTRPLCHACLPPERRGDCRQFQRAVRLR